jgi:phospholipase C
VEERDQRRDDDLAAPDIRDPEQAEYLGFLAPDEYLRRREFLQRAALTAGLTAGLATVLDPDTLVAEAARRQRRTRLPSPRNLPIDTFVVLMMENRSFDHYLGYMPEADGRQAGLSYVDRNGQRKFTRPLAPDFQGCAHPDPDHSWDDGRTHVNGGRMDGFLRSPDNDEFAISYYKEGDLGFIQPAAKALTTYDRMFCSILASTFPNREFMWAAESYGLKNNATPPQAGYPTGFPDNTIFAQMENAGLSTRYFFNDLPVSALWGARRLANSSRVEEYYTRAAAGTLPNLSFVDPAFANEGGGTSGDEHPHGDVRVGQAFMSDVVHAFMESPQWKRGALFIVYDEWGGFFDHVRPPRVPDMRNSTDVAQDFGRLGIRIPAVAISPYARRGFVSHLKMSPVSVLKMISYRFGLPPLNRRVAYSSNIARTFDWDSPPRLTPPTLPDPPAIVGQQCSNRPPSALSAKRPAEHDLTLLRDSGYLESLGFDYRPATPSSTFRQPSKVVAAHRAADRR